MAGLATLAARLRELHRPLLVLPNAWDAESARRFAALGATAIATTSGGVAESVGYEDGEKTPPDAMFAAVAEIAGAVEVPVTADLEAGYRLPAEELVDRMLAAGVVGLNLEDTDHYSDAALVEAGAHAERLAAIRAAGQERGVEVVINARVDVQLRGAGDVEAGVERARAYREAGADCVYPIFVADEEEIAAYVRAAGTVNVLLRPAAPAPARLRELGVARATWGTGLKRMGLEPAVEAVAAAREELDAAR
jgi:2-methylisocitrate lyase-like PEP mutase family enzyme